MLVHDSQVHKVYIASGGGGGSCLTKVLTVEQGQAANDVFEKMKKCVEDHYAEPSSTHGTGRCGTER